MTHERVLRTAVSEQLFPRVTPLRGRSEAEHLETVPNPHEHFLHKSLLTFS